MGLKHDCVICQGSGFIRLPVRRPLSARPVMEREISMHIDDIARTYKCPECSGEQVADEKVLIACAESRLDARFAGERGAKEAIRKEIAHTLAHYFMEHDLIEFQERDEGERILTRGTLGVVRPGKVQTIRQRALEQAKQILAGAVDKATEQIWVWGSAYSGDEGSVSKGQAVSAIRHAFNMHMHMHMHMQEAERND